MRNKLYEATTTNVFINLAYEYINLLNCIPDDLKSSSHTFSYVTKKSKTFRSDNNTKISLFNSSLSLANELFDDNTDYSRWFSKLEEFSEFIRFAEKCFLYRNESDSADNNQYMVYSEKNNDEDKLYIKTVGESNIKFTFTNSNVLDIVQEGSAISRFINASDDKIKFINVIIKRYYGKGLCSEFNFISDEEPIFKDQSDNLLMSTIRCKSCIVIKNILDDIFNILIPNIYGLEYFYMWRPINYERGFRLFL